MLKGENMKRIKNVLEEQIKKAFKEKFSNINKIKFNANEVIFLLIITSVISIIVGFTIKKPTDTIIEDESLKGIIDNYNNIVNNYYGEVDKEKIVSGAIEGMISSLGDEYSELINRDTNTSFYINLEGQYEGIGVEIYNNENNDVVVLGIIKDSPASKAGLKTGDILKKIDDKELTNTHVSALTKYVQENKKPTYELVIIRDGVEQNITIDRTTITIKSVLSKTFEKNNKKIGYIYMSVFANATSKQFQDALKELEKDDIDALIIDVRNNSGGYLTTAMSVISNFLSNKKVMYQIEKDGKKTKVYSKGAVTKKYPIVVLQNELSASASELLASSLKESYKATVIGTKSYGKNTVQELVDLESGETYKFTTKSWLTPQGNSIYKVGVKPDIEVKLDDKYYDDPTDENDNQLQTALDYLAK